jgi:adenosylcobinamide kinase / adenosylcobinamide-phosphate guanylyltransferase
MSIAFTRTQLILGGARSGKSAFGQRQAEDLPGTLLYVATAQALDSEMDDRIARHRAERGARWQTLEAPLALAEAIAAHSRPETVLTAAIAAAPGKILLVSNEVGLGIVPDNALARRFRDMAGTINQAIARTVDSVVFVAAGLPLVLK